MLVTLLRRLTVNLKFFLVIILSVVIVFMLWEKTLEVIDGGYPQAPDLNEEKWWGNAYSKLINAEFKIDIRRDAVDKLNERFRLSAIRLVPSIEDSRQIIGLNKVVMRDFLEYLALNYNWTERLERINKFTHFKIGVQGLNIHVIKHVNKDPKHRRNKIIPILLLHGFGSSFIEYLDVAEFLVEIIRNGVVFIASLPGFGFSEGTHQSGLGSAQMAVVMKNLMVKLGYETFYVHASGSASSVAKDMAILYPYNVQGLHSSSCAVYSHSIAVKYFIGAIYPAYLEEEGNPLMKKIYPVTYLIDKMFRETGFSHMQSTKPDTLGMALSDSPLGLAAYLLERFIIWAGEENIYAEDGNLKSNYNDYGRIVDNFLMYYFSHSITTSMRFDAESWSSTDTDLKLYKMDIDVPTACMALTQDLFYYPEKFLKTKYKNLLAYNVKKGGRLFGFQHPRQYAGDIANAIKLFEKFYESPNEKKSSKRTEF